MARIKNLETDSHVFFVGIPFSQWHMCSFEDDHGREFNCTEQYMMFHKAMLFGDTDTAEKIMQAATPREQKELGRQVENFDVEVWEHYARDIVYQGNVLKFSQNPGLWFALAQTEQKQLVEASAYDSVWGIGLGANDPRCLDEAQWDGKNWLGETLMRVRDDFFNEGKHVPAVHEVSRQDRSYVYAFLGLQVPGTDYFTTFKAIAEHANMEVDNLIDYIELTLPRDGDFDELEVPVNDGEKTVSITINSLLSANSEIFAFTELIKNAEMYDGLGVDLKTPRLDI